MAAERQRIRPADAEQQRARCCESSDERADDAEREAERRQLQAFADDQPQTSLRLAPRARRTPISGVRCATAYDITP